MNKRDNNLSINIVKPKRFIRFGFTMAEAVLVMTILGIIATIMITTLKPAEFKERGLKVLAQKVIAEIDNATTQILLKHSPDGTMNNIYILNSETLCTGSSAYSSNTDCKNNITVLYKKYLGTKRSMTTPIETLLEKYNISYSNTPITPSFFDTLTGGVAWGGDITISDTLCGTIYVPYGEFCSYSESKNFCLCLKENNRNGIIYMSCENCGFYSDNSSESNTPFSSFELKDGAVMIFYPSDSSIFKILVDINGGEEPNIHNKDVFWLYVNSDGIDYETSESPNCS